VITNFHVFEKAAQAEIRLSDGRTLPVQAILGEDEEGDLIRLRVDLQGKWVQPLVVNEKIPETGEKVVVMGTPLDSRRRSQTESSRRSGTFPDLARF